MLDLLRHVVAMCLGGWVGGHARDLWPNGERYGVGLNRGHTGKCLWVFDWHYQI